jgi:DNA-binding Xre family transcriptional regulator
MATMNTAVSFKTPNGEEMIVLSRHDYDALLEKAELAEDLATVAEYRKKLAAGDEEAIPEEFANRLIEGENPIRVYRELRGLTGKELAERTGISAAFLSEIETGKKDGGIATLKRVAQELGVMLDDLVEGTIQP